MSIPDAASWYWLKDFQSALSGDLGKAMQDRAERFMEDGEFYAKRPEYGAGESWKVWRDVRQAEATQPHEQEKEQ